MKVQDVTGFTNPFTGQKGNITNIASIWNMVLGVVVVLFTFATGQKIANSVEKTTKIVDTSPTPIVQKPTVQSKQVRVY